MAAARSLTLPAVTLMMRFITRSFVSSLSLLIHCEIWSVLIFSTTASFQRASIARCTFSLEFSMTLNFVVTISDQTKFSVISKSVGCLKVKSLVETSHPGWIICLTRRALIWKN